MTYMQRLVVHNLESLEVRHIFHALVYIHKNVFGYVGNDASDMFTFNQDNTRGHRFKMKVEYKGLKSENSFM